MEDRPMTINRTALLAVVLAATVLGGCQSARLGSLDTRPVRPEPLPAAPTGVVVQNQLPPPAAPVAPTPAADAFPTVPPPPAGAPTPVAGTEVAAAAPTGGADVTAGAVAGVWNVSVGGQSCRIATPQTSFGQGFRGAPLGCPAPMASFKSWAPRGKQLVLFDDSGTQIATLFSSGGSRFDGQTSSGQPISLSR
jgi:hypothetical protein